jgi:hypothetical protein
VVGWPKVRIWHSFSLTLPRNVRSSPITDGNPRGFLTHTSAFANSHLLLRTMVFCATVALRSGIVLTTAIAVG